MKRVAMVAAVLLACQTGVAWAQKADTASSTGMTAKSDVRTISQGNLKPTEQMWFYEQAMRHTRTRNWPSAGRRNSAASSADSAWRPWNGSGCPMHVRGRVPIRSTATIRPAGPPTTSTTPIAGPAAPRRSLSCVPTRTSILVKHVGAKRVPCERPKPRLGSGPRRRSCEGCAARAP